MQPIEISNGNKTAVVSLWMQAGSESPRYVMAGRNGGASKVYKTLKAAVSAAEKYVNGK